MDQADQCSSAGEVLLVQCEDHSVWELIMDLQTWHVCLMLGSAYGSILLI